MTGFARRLGNSLSIARADFEELKITIEDLQAQVASYKRFMAIDSLLVRLLILAGDLNLTGGLNLTGDLAVTGNTDLTGALDVTGNTTLDGGNLDVTGNAEITGNTTLNGGDLDVTGDVGITGASTLTGALGVTGDFSLTGDQIVKGASRVIRGDGSNAPDLGSTTAAEQWGHIYQLLARDIYPDGETNIDAGFWTRYCNRYGLSNVTTHAREGSGIPTGLTAWQVLAPIYVAQDATYTGYLRDTFYQMMSVNTAPLQSFLADTSTQPLTTQSWQVGRFLTTGGMNIGIRVDNYDTALVPYPVGGRLYYYEIILYGLAPRTQILYNHGYWVWNGAAWGGNVNTAGTAVTVHPISEAVTLAIYQNYGVNNNTCAGYVVGEHGKVSNYGSVVMYNDAGVTPYGARRAGPTVSNRVYVGCSFDWWYASWQ